MLPAAIACFGEVLWDIFELDPPPLGARLVRVIGGAPANVATVLARLGVRVRLVGGVGQDRFGEELCAALAAEGVDVGHMVKLPQRTGLAFVRRDAAGEPSFLFYRQGTADVSVGARDITPAMGHAALGLVGTSTLMTPRLRGATSAFARALKRAGGALVVDLNVRAHMWNDHEEMRERVGALAAQATIIKASEGDLLALASGAASQARSRSRRLAYGVAWLRERAPRATTVFTRAAGPASVVGAFGEVVAPAGAEVACVDATGAGDAFIAGVMAALVTAGALPGTPGFSDLGVWREALALGHVLGQKAISKPGAVTGIVALSACHRTLARLSKRATPVKPARGEAR